MGEGEDAEEIASLEDLEVEGEEVEGEDENIVAENLEEGLDTAAGGDTSDAPTATTSSGAGNDGSLDSAVTGGDARVSSAFNLLSSASDGGSTSGGGGTDQTFISAAVTEEVPGVTEGRVIDGYIQGATVFADANEDGVLDAGEASATTDETGGFAITGGAGPLVMFGGVDTATGLSFEGVLRAPEGSSVVTPITTVISSLMDAGNVDGTEMTVDQASAILVSANYIPAGVDIANFDPIAASLSTDSALAEVGASVTGAGVLFHTLAVQATAVLSGAGATASEEAIAAAVYEAIAATVQSDVGGTETDGSYEGLLLAAAGTLDMDTSAEGTVSGASSAYAEMVEATADAISATIASGAIGSGLLTEITQIAIVSQGDAANNLEAAVSGVPLEGQEDAPSLTDVSTSFTGDNLVHAVDDAADQVLDVDGSGITLTVALVGDEDAAVSGSLVPEDADGAALTFTLISPPDAGIITLNAAGDYTFSPSQAFESLGEGVEQEVLFTYSVSDGTQTLTTSAAITVTGTNDVPTIAVAAASSSVTELADGAEGENASDLTTTGSIAFADVDLTDAHTVSVTGGDGVHGALAASIVDASTDDGAGSIDWTYTVPDGVVDYLGAGDSVVQTYTVTVTDD